MPNASSPQIASLRDHFSEYALIKYRVLVECRWLQMLSSREDIPEVQAFSPAANALIESLCTEFTPATAAEVKEVERTTNHDVKAVEYVIKDKLIANEELASVLEFTHFACTSEDINNLSHALMLKHALEEEILPAMDAVIGALFDMSKRFAGVY
jgi:adenylosuccinate lyase